MHFRLSLILVMAICSAAQLHANTDLLSHQLEQIEFVETPLADAVEYLRLRSMEVDPAKQGLNIIIDPAVDMKRSTSLKLNDVSIGMSLICLAEQVGVDYRRDRHAFMIVPAGTGTLAEQEMQPRQNHFNSEQVARARALQMAQIEFKEAPLSDVLEFVAAKSRENPSLNTDLNLVVNYRVDQDLPVTLRLNQVPASAVLGYIARTTGVEIRVEPWAIIIEPPGTKFYREARIREAKQKLAAARMKNRPRGTAPKLGTPPNDPRSPAHPDYVHSANPDVSKRTNALNNVYKWKGGKWSFVRYGSRDKVGSSLEIAPLGTRKR